MVLLHSHINLSLASLPRDAITTACSVVSTSFTAIQPRCAIGAVLPGDTNRCYQTSCSLSKSWNRAAPSQHYAQYRARAKRNVDVFDKCTYNSHPNKYWGALLIYRVKAAGVSTTQQCPACLWMLSGCGWIYWVCSAHSTSLTNPSCVDLILILCAKPEQNKRLVPICLQHLTSS